MTGFVLGIDGGGTKTVCVLMDAKGEVLGRGEAGPSNYQTIGIQAAGDSILRAIRIAAHSSLHAQAAHSKFFDVEGICLGLAGVGRSEDIRVVQDWVKELQLLGEDMPVRLSFNPAGVVVCNDCAIALVGGVGEPVGIVTIAGTGAIAYGQNRQGQTKRTSGWGYLLGDEGSGYDIAVRGLRAAVRSDDGRSDATILTERIIQHLGIKNLDDLIEVVYRRGWGVKQIAALAPIVDEAAVFGDAVANAIIDSAVEELVLSTRVVISALFNPEEAFEVVTMGGVWRGASLRSRFEATLGAIAPKATVIWPRYEPAYGAALLALRALSQN